jgi:hypothetical protein
VPESLDQRNPHIGQIGISAKDSAKLANSAFVQPIARVEPTQSATGQLEAGLFLTITLGVQALELATDYGIARSQFKCALHVPNCLWQGPLLIANNAQAHTGDETLRIGTQGSLKELDGLAVHAFLQASLAHQTIGFDVHGVVLQNMPAMSECFVVEIVPNEVLDFCSIVLQSDIWHCSPLSF